MQPHSDPLKVMGGVVAHKILVTAQRPNTSFPFWGLLGALGFGLGFASTMDAAACGTVGQGDFYWGGLASTLFWVDPVEDLYVIFMTQLIPSSTFNFRGQIKNIVYGALRSDTDH